MRDFYVNPALKLTHESFFISSTPELPGGLRSAGISRSVDQNDWPDQRQWRSFPYYTLNIMLENSRGSFRNGSGFQCEVSYGDFFLNFPGVQHLYGPGTDEYWNEMYVSFDGEIFDAYCAQKYFCAQQPVWRLKNPVHWINRLEALLRGQRPFTRNALAAETVGFLQMLLEMVDQAEPRTEGATPRDWFEKACLLLTRDLRRIDLPAVAHELDMSYPSFRRNFTRRAGMPPYQYREQHRIEIASKTLRENPSKLYKEIAFSLGYSRGDHFANQFKKHTGMLPGEYQRKFAERDK